MSIRTLLMVIGALSVPTAAAAEPTHVYVELMEIDKTIKADAASMTSPLCLEIDKSPDLEVSCAPDIQQMLSFSATAGLVGGGGAGMPSALAKRLESVSVIVVPKLKRSSKGFYVVAELFHRAQGFGGQVMNPGEPIGRVLLKTGKTSVAVVLARMPSLGESVAAKILTPEGKLPPTPTPVE